MKSALLIVAIVAAVAVAMTGHASASTTRHYAVVQEPATLRQRQQLLNHAASAGYRLAAVDGSSFILVRGG